jgi:hypothetical protein
MNPWVERLRSLTVPAPGDVAEGRSDPPPEIAVVPEIIHVSYQYIFYDYDLPDGTYLPAELQRAGLLVKRGPILRYRLPWPGGIPQPIDVAGGQESRLKSKPNAVGAPVVAVK